MNSTIATRCQRKRGEQPTGCEYERSASDEYERSKTSKGTPVRIRSVFPVSLERQQTSDVERPPCRPVDRRATAGRADQPIRFPGVRLQASWPSPVPSEEQAAVAHPATTVSRSRRTANLRARAARCIGSRRRRRVPVDSDRGCGLARPRHGDPAGDCAPRFLRARTKLEIIPGSGHLAPPGLGCQNAEHWRC
jgi:hypothetical protein